MTKYNIMASQIENDTTASISILLEDETFKNLFIDPITGEMKESTC